MNSKNEMNKEFLEFLSASEVSAPRETRDSVLQFVNQDLNPTFQSVLLKILGVHALTSVLSLSLCSQFGVRTFPVYDLMHSLMNAVGETACLGICGALYLGLSALMMSFFLRPQDVRMIRKQKFLQISILSGASLGVFLCLGASFLVLPTLLWIAGSLIGGISTLELGWQIRAYFRRKLIYGL